MINVKFLSSIILKVNILKTIYYSLKFKGIVIIGFNTKLYISKKSRIIFSDKKSSLYLGVHFNSKQGTVIDMHEDSVFIVGKSVSIHKGCKVVVRTGGVLRIGNNTYINEQSRLQCSLKIDIGNDCSIGWCTNILDTDLHGIYEGNILLNPNLKVEIGSKVWICANVSILKGTKISNNVIVGVSSIIAGKKLESNSIYAGNPAKFVRKIERWGKI